MTLDTNCLIDLEQASLNAKHIRDLVHRQERGEIGLRLPAISASERQPGGGFLHNFADFQKRVEAAGLGGVRLIQPIGYRDVTFWDFSFWADAAMRKLEARIHAVLNPSLEFEYSDYCKARGLDPGAGPIDRNWRNAKCDVLVAWSHISRRKGHARRELHEGHKLPALLALGAGAVVRPRHLGKELR